MELHITPGSGRPIYQQIVSQVSYLVASGRLKAGDEIPPIRALAQRLLVNPNTVARAYRELEAAGLTTSRQGAGTCIANGKSPLARRERLRILTERIDALLAEASQLNVDYEDVVELMQRQRDAMKMQHEE